MKSIFFIIFVILCSLQNIKAQSGFSYRDNGLFARQELNSPSDENKSMPMAVIYSLLVPGMGELYVGNYSKGKYFTIAEGALWVTLIAFDQYGRWIQSDARHYAVQHAGITLAGKDDKFFVNIGDFQSVQDYNDYQLRIRNPYKLYDVNSEAWNWDSKSNREYYRNQRVSSDQMFNSTSYVAAAIGVNHLISAINAALMVKSHNDQISQTNQINIHASVMGGITRPHGIMVSFSKSF